MGSFWFRGVKISQFRFASFLRWNKTTSDIIGSNAFQKQSVWRSWSYFFLFGLYLFHTVHSGGVSRGKVCGSGCWPRWHVLGEAWKIPSDYFCFTKTQPSGPSLSISRFVRLCVCMSVCVSVHFLSVPLNVLLPPLPKIECQKCLENRNPLGKVMERWGFKFENFCS